MNLIRMFGQKNRTYNTNQISDIGPTLFMDIIHCNPFTRVSFLEKRAFKSPGDLSLEFTFDDEAVYNEEVRDLIMGFRDVLFLREHTEKNGYSKRLIVGMWNHSTREVECYKFNLNNQKTKIDFSTTEFISWKEGCPFEERFLNFVTKIGGSVNIDLLHTHLESPEQYSYYALSRKGFLTRFKDASSLRSDHIFIFKVSAPIPPGMLSKSVFEKKKTVWIKSNSI